MRQTYQKQSDLDNELSVMKRLVATMDAEVYFHHGENGFCLPRKNIFGFEKSPNFACYDYTLTCDDVDAGFGSGSPVAVVEIKCRNYNHNAFNSYKISKNKIDNLVNTSVKHEIVSVLLVKWRDDICTGMLVDNPFCYSGNYLDYPVTDEAYEIFEGWDSDISACIQSGQITKTTWGRSDRNDPMDIEACYEIPMSLFRVV